MDHKASVWDHPARWVCPPAAVLPADAGLANQLSVFALQLAGDPRREDLVKPYEPSLPTEPTGDIIMMIGLGCAAFGLLTKVCMPHAL